ncbi:MAG: flagellar basal body protein [Planctomycetota bacterium]
MAGLPSQFYLIGNAMLSAEQNHAVIGQNIANSNTPGYQTKSVDFEQVRRTLQGSSGNSGFVQQFPVVSVDGLTSRLDGNNVDIEKQLAEIKKNSLAFQTYSHLLAAKMNTMRSAIRG